MEVILTTPDAVASKVQNGSTMPQHDLAELEARVLAQGHKFYGIFADDPGALEVFDEIERLRDQETLANTLAVSQP